MDNYRPRKKRKISEDVNIALPFTSGIVQDLRLIFRRAAKDKKGGQMMIKDLKKKLESYEREVLVLKNELEQANSKLEKIKQISCAGGEETLSLEEDDSFPLLEI
eukprot:TRINITY_DN11882_c0_g1_i1.p1 TRINITY_DN11882_c0_g1~~TRINITY_DN11882_c0_g1_i1.p1  ORF type:complete len:113 (+),score=25.95 TRINITY_DN11882_c0_g1_i1:26-340(+)